MTSWAALDGNITEPRSGLGGAGEGRIGVGGRGAVSEGRWHGAAAMAQGVPIVETAAVAGECQPFDQPHQPLGADAVCIEREGVGPVEPEEVGAAGGRERGDDPPPENRDKDNW